MFKGRKLAKAEKEFSKSAKSFDQFCEDNNIELSKPIKNSFFKRNVWIGISATAAVAIITVCSCIPLMRQNGDSTALKYYGDNDVQFDMCRLSDIESVDSNMFDTSKIEEYTLSQIIRLKENDTSVVGYSISSIIYFDEIHLFEFDYIVRTNKRYRFKDLTLYKDFSDKFVLNDVSYNYRLSKDNANTCAYITYEYSEYDYYIRLYETDYSTEINNENVETFIRIAFGEE